MDEWLVERVLLATECIPPGRVASYGDLARLVGTGPRQVGAILARFGSSVPWWRVTNASGEFPPDLLVKATPHWTDEGIGLKPDGRGCSMRRYRADLRELAAVFQRTQAVEGQPGG